VPATLPPLPPPHFLPLVPLPSVPLPLPLSSLHRLHPPPLRLIHRSSSCSTRRCLPLAMLDHNSLLFSPTRDGVPSSDDNFYASDLIAAQDALEDEAREAIPFASTECTYDMGYVKQPLFACLTCLHNRAVCAGCSVSCHGCALLLVSFCLHKLTISYRFTGNTNSSSSSTAATSAATAVPRRWALALAARSLDDKTLPPTSITSTTRTSGESSVFAARLTIRRQRVIRCCSGAFVSSPSHRLFPPNAPLIASFRRSFFLHPSFLLLLLSPSPFPSHFCFPSSSAISSSDRIPFAASPAKTGFTGNVSSASTSTRKTRVHSRRTTSTC
jgi:hypothetical protein